MCDFQYDSTETKSENFKRWLQMTRDEQETWGIVPYTEPLGKEIFESLYPVVDQR
jgi:hypothetical protein